MNQLIIFFGKILSKISKLLNLGHGSTWPGHIALKINPDFISDLLRKSGTKVIFVTGTNGKTTTSKLIETILVNNNKKVITNSSGANLLNGIASSIIINNNFLGIATYDYVIFEIDENVLPLAAAKLEPDYIIALNLFRDQLDRYGELDSIVKKWKKIYESLSRTTFLLNADDPQIAFLGNNLKFVFYFGLNNVKIEHKNYQHASDSILCPKCGEKLVFDAFYFSHLGKWRCNNCGLARPKLSIEEFSYFPLSGTYAIYDTLAAVLLARILNISDENIKKSLQKFIPAFGRQEKINLNGIFIQFFLSKNPTSFNESLRTINQSSPKNLLMILNDRIPDGTDVSWIWDIDFETLISNKTKLYIAGDRVYDLAIRLKYAGIDIKNIFENLEEAVFAGLKNTNENETFYILPTYSAMLETRKILTGKKIL
jgi:UDP-N-acetylmuramyl tripeptide synthase